MKRIRMTMGLMVVLVFFLSASIWEGTAAVAPEEELPQEGFFAATNTFPLNTEVYITNLQNGKTIRAVITASLNSPAFLAMLSRDAADAMEIEDQSVARVRLIPPSEITQFSRFNEMLNSGRISGSENQSGTFSPPMIFVPESALVRPDIPDKSTGRNPGDEEIPDTMATAPRPEERSSPDLFFPQGPAEPTETISGTSSTSSGSYEGYDLTLVPAEERPPSTAGSWWLPGDAEIAPLASSSTQSNAEIDPSLIIPSLESDDSALSPAQNNSVRYSDTFSVPVIYDLEKGKYYLQLRAFGRVELVEAELSRIGNNYPLVIQPTDSVYRILVGPVSLGESGALLQRFKGIGYDDAFIRQGIY